MPNNQPFIFPQWFAPFNVQALSTTRWGGVSQAPFDSLNLSLSCGDCVADVHTNRQMVQSYAQLEDASPFRLSQVHGTQVVQAELSPIGTEADACFTQQLHQPCCILTADCAPVLFCYSKEPIVAAAHAGWRGLAGGILENTVQRMADTIGETFKPQHLLAWIGPCIGPKAFEVGDEIRIAFVRKNDCHSIAFTPARPGHWLANLPLLTWQTLASLGIHQIYGGNWCTYSTPNMFYSYRRDGKNSGRMASMIWLE